VQNTCMYCLTITHTVFKYECCVCCLYLLQPHIFQDLMPCHRGHALLFLIHKLIQYNFWHLSQAYFRNLNFMFCHLLTVSFWLVMFTETDTSLNIFTEFNSSFIVLNHLATDDPLLSCTIYFFLIQLVNTTFITCCIFCQRHNL